MNHRATCRKLMAIAVALGLFACGESSGENPESNESSNPGGTPPAATGEPNAPETPVDTPEEPEPMQPSEPPVIGPAPEPPDATGAVFTDDFESGTSSWDITQGTCSATADATTVLTCINGGNEARAVAGDASWTDVTIAANVMIRQMDDGRRIYLAGRFIDSNNWYGAGFYNSGTRRVQIRKKVAGSSEDIAEATFPFELNTWYTLKLQISGSTLTLSVDGVVQAEGTDTEFTSGRVALLVDRSEVSWDNVVVTTP